MNYINKWLADVFGSKAGAQSTEPYQPGLDVFDKIIIFTYFRATFESALTFISALEATTL